MLLETTILLVEDDPQVLDLMERFAGAVGYRTALARDGHEAIAMLDKSEFDVVVTDLIMPRVSGMELLAHIQSTRPRLGVIVVTGYGDEVGYTEVIQAGASDFITKPFGRDEFIAKLNRIMREQRIRRELERLSTSDALTGLHNRRYFDLRFWKESHRARRQQYSLYLALIDIDHFKEFNDTYGHLAGDNALQAVGRVLEACTRTNVDTCYRFGGDEFTIILPQTTAEQACEVAERIVVSYSALKFGWTELSVGLARFEHHEGEEWSESIRRTLEWADQAMYQAKNSPQLNVVEADS